jgi:hypothetical protein
VSVGVGVHSLAKAEDSRPSKFLPLSFFEIFMTTKKEH